jgi:hypothetical protein
LPGGLCPAAEDKCNEVINLEQERLAGNRSLLGAVEASASCVPANPVRSSGLEVIIQMTK